MEKIPSHTLSLESVRYVKELNHSNLYWILQDDVGVVFLGTDARHGFEDDSYVTFHDVKGMTELNGKEFQIKVTSNSSFLFIQTIYSFVLRSIYFHDW